MDNHIKSAYLTLLKSSITKETSVKSNFILSENEWHQLYRLTMQQATLGVLFPSITVLSQSYQAPQAVLLDGIAKTNYIRMHNRHMLQVLQEIIQLLKEIDVEPVVMKGFSFAANYQNPELRMCNDIDLYIPGNYKETIHFLKSKGFEFEVTSQHHKFYYKKILIELHHHLINPPFDELKDINYTWCQYNHISFKVPDITAQALLLLTHAATHLAGPGISFRFLYDWAAFLQKHAEELNKVSFRQTIKRYHLSRFVSVFTTAASELLGVPHPTFIPQNHSFLLKQLTKDMFTQGDCGQIERKNRLHSNQLFNYYKILVRLLKFSPYSIRLSYKIAKNKIHLKN